jgi:anaphase-promoting complex subunit 6
MEAVTSLHEAVRVLGASGGGDAAGGAGIAGTLLSRALEIWALENREKDKSLPDDIARASSSRSSTRSRDKGKGKLSSEERTRRRAISHDQHSEEWTDDVARVDGSTTAAESATLEEKVEMELDDEADGLLRQALGRVRVGRQRRRLAMSPDPEDNETPAPPAGHSHGSRVPRHARQ